MKKPALALMSALLVVQSLSAKDALNSDDKPAPRQYTYSWMFSDVDAMKPRGGTTSEFNASFADRLCTTSNALTSDRADFFMM